MGKPEFCICENKDVYQLCSSCTADQHLCFCFCYAPNFEEVEGHIGLGLSVQSVRQSVCDV